MKRTVLSSMLLVVACAPAFCATATAGSDDLYGGWLKMYDLRFGEAHQTISRWQQAHPTDSLGAASQAAAYLFSELARLGVLESELFVDDREFQHRKRLQPDPEAKRLFLESIGTTERLADESLQKSASDRDALLSKSLSMGLQADYAALVEKRSIASLGYTKQSRFFSEKLLAADPTAYDAYLGPGVENYLLSLKAAPVRFVLELTGSRIDREKGIAQLKLTAAHGHYLEPFAKLLLAVAALRDKDTAQARNILQELHDRFPNNELYERELTRLPLGTR